MNLENLNLTELETKDMIDTTGGESGWYWLAYAVGVLVNAPPAGHNTTTVYTDGSYMYF